MTLEKKKEKEKLVYKLIKGPGFGWLPSIQYVLLTPPCVRPWNLADEFIYMSGEKVNLTEIYASHHHY